MIGNALFPLCRCALTPLLSQLLYTGCVCRKLSLLWKTFQQSELKHLVPQMRLPSKGKWVITQTVFFYVMQKSKLHLVACLFSHEVHSMIRLRKSSILEHWKTLQEGWVNVVDTLYGLFLILDNLLCKGESLNK